MAETNDADREGPTSVAAYQDAQQRITALDVDGRLRGFQIPLMLILNPWHDNVATQCAAKAERLVATGRVALAGTSDTAQDAVYVLDQVRIAPSPWLYRDWSEFLLELHKYVGRACGVRALGCAGLNRLHALGLHITTAVGLVEDDAHFLEWMASDHRALTLGLLATSNAELWRVYTSCRGLGDRLTALTLCQSDRDMDAALMARIWRDLPRVCPLLRSMEVVGILPRGVWDALRHALTVERMASAYVHPVRAFTMVWLKSKEVVSQPVLTTLAHWLPRLESLTLRHFRRGQLVMDDAGLEIVLHVFPLLKALDVQDMDVTTWQTLLAAYDSPNGCRVRTLTLGTHGISCMPLLDALACPTKRISNVLYELEILTSRQDDDRSLLDAAEAMLYHNPVLDCFRVRLRYHL